MSTRPSTTKIRNLADSIQGILNRVRTTPIEYIECAVSKLARNGQIDLATAAALDVLPLVKASLPTAKRDVDRTLPTKRSEVQRMFKGLSRRTCFGQV